MRTPVVEVPGKAMDKIRQLLSSEAPVKWVFTGDSITHGVYHTFGHRDYVQIFDERVRSELGRVHDVIIRTAVSGWRTGNIKNEIEWNILRFDPDVVSIMIGMNDAAEGVSSVDLFADNYRAILDTIAARTQALVVLHTPNPTIPGADPEREPALPLVVERIRQIGSERRLPVIDHWAECRRAWEENPSRVYCWMGDAVHPGVYGHRDFARLLMKELGIWDEASPCCCLNIP